MEDKQENKINNNICQCGGKYTYKHHAEHNRTKKHINYIESLCHEIVEVPKVKYNNKDYYKKNKEKILQKQKERWQLNKQKLREQNKEYYQNKERKKALKEKLKN